jgi:hypothetical protein
MRATQPRPPKPKPSDAFKAVIRSALVLPGVQCRTKYDGSPVLTVGGCFMAGLATHRSASGTLVVRSSIEDRQCLLEDAPHVYYVTEYYRRFPVVLARLSLLDADTLRDLLSMSRRLTIERRARGPAEEHHNC